MLFVKHDVAFLFIRNFWTHFRAHYTCWTLGSSYVTIGFSDILSRWPFVKQKMKLMQLCDGGNKTLYDHYLIVKVKYDWMERWAVRWVCCAPIIVRDSVVVSFIYIIFLSSGACIPPYHDHSTGTTSWMWYTWNEGGMVDQVFRVIIPPYHQKTTVPRVFLLDRTVPEGHLWPSKLSWVERKESRLMESQ
jgi:hypothetical protein